MKQTAVEFYENQIFNLQLQLEKKEISIGEYAVERFQFFKQAKEMEKQQIVEAYDEAECKIIGRGEQYYNETFKSE